MTVNRFPEQILVIAYLIIVSFIHPVMSETLEIEGETTATLDLVVDSDSPTTGGALGALRLSGMDSSSTLTLYAQLLGTIASPDAGSGAGAMSLQVKSGGSMTEIARVDGSGLSVEAGDATVKAGTVSIGQGEAGYSLPAARGATGLYLRAAADGTTEWSLVESIGRLSDVNDVSTASLAANHALIWNGSVWAPSTIGSDSLGSGAVTESKIADGAVTAAKLADGPGSGVDADTVDGVEASAFLQSESDTLADVTARGASTMVELRAAGGIVLGDGATTWVLPIERGVTSQVLTMLADGTTTWAATSNVGSLGDLQNVSAASPASGEALIWSGSQWEPTALQDVEYLSDLFDIDTAGANSGDILIYDGAEWAPQAATGLSDTLDDVASRGASTGEEITLNGGLNVQGGTIISDQAVFEDEVTFEDNVEVQGTIDANTLNTGLGDNELYAMNQNVRSSDAVTFATINTGQGSHELYAMNQNVRTTDDTGFESVSIAGGSHTWDSSSDLEAHYKMNEASGNLIDSANGHTATQTGSIGSASGLVNGSRDFTNSPYAQNTTGDFDGVGNNLSVAVWIKPDAYDHSQMVCWGWGDYSWSPQTSWGIMCYSGATIIQARVVNSSHTTAWLNIPASGFDTSIWHHLVLTYDGATAHLYLDGNLAVSQNLSGPIRAVAHLDIGGYWGGYKYNGLLDDLRIYSTALTESQIALIINDGAGSEDTTFSFPMDVEGDAYIDGTLLCQSMLQLSDPQSKVFLQREASALETRRDAQLVKDAVASFRYNRAERSTRTVRVPTKQLARVSEPVYEDNGTTIVVTGTREVEREITVYETQEVPESNERLRLEHLGFDAAKLPEECVHEINGERYVDTMAILAVLARGQNFQSTQAEESQAEPQPRSDIGKGQSVVEDAEGQRFTLNKIGESVFVSITSSNGDSEQVNLTQALQDLSSLTGRSYQESPPIQEPNGDSSTRIRERLIQNAKMEILLADPWTPVEREFALRHVQETESQEQPVIRTEYRVNSMTGEVEQYTLESVEIVNVPINSWRWEIKPDCRLDKSSGKFYRRKTLDEINLDEGTLARIEERVAALFE